MSWIMDIIVSVFSRDLLLVVLGSWLTVMAQVFGLKGPLRKLIVEALRDAGKDAKGKSSV